LNGYLRNNRFPSKYSAKSVKASVNNGKVKPGDLALYLENANAALFNSPVIGAEVYKSTNGGKSWKKTHDDYIDGMYSSYGYYFGVIAVNPSNENKIYILGVPLLKSDDGGKTFARIGKENVHSDHQAIWVNPKMEGHVINGNDGGVNITYDDGENWTKNNSTSVVSGFIKYRMTGGMELAKMEEMYNAMPENVKASIYGVKIKDKIDLLNSVAVGKTAPDFTLNTPEETPSKLKRVENVSFTLFFNSVKICLPLISNNEICTSSFVPKIISK